MNPNPRREAEERYAEGNREPSECRKCGQPVWIVYHGPNRNHTLEPRDTLRSNLKALAYELQDKADEREMASADLATTGDPAGAAINEGLRLGYQDAKDRLEALLSEGSNEH
jgi:hypothetical protein